jgi:hypothetical protein
MSGSPAKKLNEGKKVILVTVNLIFHSSFFSKLTKPLPENATNTLGRDRLSGQRDSRSIGDTTFGLEAVK